MPWMARLKLGYRDGPACRNKELERLRCGATSSLVPVQRVIAMMVMVTVYIFGLCIMLVSKLASPVHVRIDPLHSFPTHTPYKNVRNSPRPLVPLRVHPRDRLRTSPPQTYFFQSLTLVQTTSPTESTTFTGGQQATISWQDDGKTPSLASFGLASVSIYVGNALQQTSLQTIVPSVNVSTTASIQFTPDPKIGPNSAE